MISIIKTDARNGDFIQLVQLLDADLAVSNGEAQAFFTQFNQLTFIQHVVVAYAGNEGVGCGAFKAFAPGVVEIKRMFVKAYFRGQGISRKVLQALEAWAMEEGFHTAVLETSTAQTAAIGLYTGSGYIRIPNYGQYEGVESSVCFKKKLR